LVSSVPVLIYKTSTLSPLSFVDPPCLPFPVNLSLFLWLLDVNDKAVPTVMTTVCLNCSDICQPKELRNVIVPGAKGISVTNLDSICTANYSKKWNYLQNFFGIKMISESFFERRTPKMRIHVTQ